MRLMRRGIPLLALAIIREAHGEKMASLDPATESLCLRYAPTSPLSRGGKAAP
jgi:hypothetical protein